jgi:hypothetical protein
MLRSGYGGSKGEQATAETRASPVGGGPQAERPILWWWSGLYLVSVGNLVLWLVIARGVRDPSDAYVTQQLWLSGVFAAACAFRSVLPRVDLERQCLWDSPLSSIFVGRSVATVAELCFSAQCALLIEKLSALTGNPWLQAVAWAIVPLIVVAQACCWFAVISLNHLGHAVEETLWSLMVFLVAVSLGLSWTHMPAGLRILSGLGMAACAGAAFLMLAIDVPMYLARWRDGRSSGVQYLPVMEGVKDALRRRRVAHAWSDWRPEVPWMSLYFTAGVWISLCLVFV